MVFFFINYNNFWVFKSFWKITFRMIYWFNHKGKIYFSTLLWPFFPQFSLLIPLKTSLKFWFSDVFKGIKRSSGGVLWKKCSWKFHKIHRKTLVPEFLCTCEYLCPQACNFMKKETLAQVFSIEFFKIFKNTCFFIEHLRWLFLLVFLF